MIFCWLKTIGHSHLCFIPYSLVLSIYFRKYIIQDAYVYLYCLNYIHKIYIFKYFKTFWVALYFEIFVCKLMRIPTSAGTHSGRRSDLLSMHTTHDCAAGTICSCSLRIARASRECTHTPFWNTAAWCPCHSTVAARADLYRFYARSGDLTHTHTRVHRHSAHIRSTLCTRETDLQTRIAIACMLYIRTVLLGAAAGRRNAPICWVELVQS